MVTNGCILCHRDFTDYQEFESINQFVMMNMECCKEWIKLYKSKGSRVAEERNLFHRKMNYYLLNNSFYNIKEYLL